LDYAILILPCAIEDERPLADRQPAHQHAANNTHRSNRPYRRHLPLPQSIARKSTTPTAVLGFVCQFRIMHP